VGRGQVLLCYEAIFSIIADFIGTLCSLKAKNAREHWEKEFNARYIQPVLGHLDVRLGTALDLISNDDKQSTCVHVMTSKVRVFM
jgi:hypothetical protein